MEALLISYIKSNIELDRIGYILLLWLCLHYYGTIRQLIIDIYHLFKSIS